MSSLEPNQLNIILQNITALGDIELDNPNLRDIGIERPELLRQILRQYNDLANLTDEQKQTIVECYNNPNANNCNVNQNGGYDGQSINTNDLFPVENGKQTGGVASVDTQQLFQNFLDDNASVEQTGGGADSVDTHQLFQNFLDDNASVEQTGGVASVDTQQLFQNFLDDNASVEQTGGVDSVDTQQLFQNFLNDNASVEQTGGVDSVDTQQLINTFWNTDTKKGGMSNLSNIENNNSYNSENQNALKEDKNPLIQNIQKEKSLKLGNTALNAVNVANKFKQNQAERQNQNALKEDKDPLDVWSSNLIQKIQKEKALKEGEKALNVVNAAAKFKQNYKKGMDNENKRKEPEKSEKKNTILGFEVPSVLKFWGGKGEGGESADINQAVKLLKQHYTEKYDNN